MNYLRYFDKDYRQDNTPNSTSRTWRGSGFTPTSRDSSRERRTGPRARLYVTLPRWRHAVSAPPVIISANCSEFLTRSNLPPALNRKTPDEKITLDRSIESARAIKHLLQSSAKVQWIYRAYRGIFFDSKGGGKILRTLRLRIFHKSTHKRARGRITALAGVSWNFAVANASQRPYQRHVPSAIDHVRARGSFGRSTRRRHEDTSLSPFQRREERSVISLVISSWAIWELWARRRDGDKSRNGPPKETTTVVKTVRIGTILLGRANDSERGERRNGESKRIRRETWLGL